MRHGYLRLTFQADGDGTGKLNAIVEANGFSGRGGAWFSISQIERFAKTIAVFPLPPDTQNLLSSGFGTIEKLDQEHLAIEVYPVDRCGHIGVQVRIATELWEANRPQSQLAARVEIITSYQSLLEFSNELQNVAQGVSQEALLEGETHSEISLNK